MRFCSVLALCVVFAAPCPAQEPESNPELADLYRADQADRDGSAKAIDWTVVGPRDKARQQAVLRILQAGGVRSAADFHNAAMVFQHGSGAEDIQLAYALATLSSRLAPDDKSMKWLQAASWDRYLMRRGRPQWYGTQYQQTKATMRFQLYPVDESAVTDEERERMGVPSLSKAKEREAEFNK